MTDDRLDTKIRGLMIEIVDTTPAAPTWESIAADLDDQPLGAADTADSTDRVATERVSDDRIDDRLGIAASTATAPASDRRTAAATDELGALPAYTHRVERRRPRWRPLALIIGAIGSVTGGAFAYSALTQDDGAATPEAAVEQLVDSLTGSDLIGALEALPPSERGPLVDFARDASSEAERLGLSVGLDLGDVGGVELAVTDLSLRPEPLGEGVVAVHLGGTLTARGIGTELPLGETVLDAVGGAAGLEDFSSNIADLDGMWADEDVFVVALHEGDGWHVSAWYTYAEYLRRSAERPVPAFGAGPITPIGADSPEAAVREMATAFSTNDFERFVAMMAPDESRALYDYLPVFDLSDDFLITYERFELDIEVTGSGSEPMASIVGHDITATWDDSYSSGTTSMSFDGECFRSTQEHLWGGETEPELWDETSCRADVLADGITDAQWETMTRQDYVVVEIDGRWYVRPAASVAHAVLAGLTAADGANDIVDEDGPMWFLTQVWSVVPTPGGAGILRSTTSMASEQYGSIGTATGPDGEQLQYQGVALEGWSHDGMDADGRPTDCWIIPAGTGEMLPVPCDDPDMVALIEATSGPWFEEAEFADLGAPVED